MSSQRPQKLAHKLEHIRVIELDYSEREMADALGVDETEVSDYESGMREPSLIVLLKYARSVGVSTDILIDDSRAIRPNTGKW